jgi:hypothetical protein
MPKSGVRIRRKTVAGVSLITASETLVMLMPSFTNLGATKN